MTFNKALLMFYYPRITRLKISSFMYKFSIWLPVSEQGRKQKYTHEQGLVKLDLISVICLLKWNEYEKNLHNKDDAENDSIPGSICKT